MPETKCGFDDIPGGASGRSMLVTLGPTLAVNIGFDPSFKPDQAHAPRAGVTGIAALVDTGATESCIDNLLASQLGLPIINRRLIAGVHGAKEVNEYLAQVHVVAMGRTIYGAFAGVDLAAGGQPHKALIGRTFLQHINMIYNGQTGSVTISW